MDMLSKENFRLLDEYIDKKADKRGTLIEVLHKAQNIFGYLPREVQEHIAEKLNIPVSKVYGTVTFYAYFTMEPKGKYAINVCLGTVCYVKGADKVLAEFEKNLGIKNNQCTKDGMFSLGGLRCVGACGIAPAVMVNDEVYGNFRPEDVKPLIQKLREGVKEENIVEA